MGERHNEIAEPAVSARVGLLKPSDTPRSAGTPGEAASNKSAQKQPAKARARAKKAREARVSMARDILRRMARAEAVDMIVPALAKQMQAAPQRQEFYALLALMGPKSIPVLRQEARDLVAKKNLSKADANNIRRLGELLGGEMGSAIDAVIPDRSTEETWSNDRYWIHYGGGFWPLAHAKPNPKHIPAFLDLVKNDRLLRQYYFRDMRLTGMLLSGMGDAAALPLADLMRDPNPQTRWAAATILSMIGPDMKAALPAIEEAYADKNEDVGVRVAAARAIAEIRSANPFDLYKEILKVESRIVVLSGENRKMPQSHRLWQEHFETEPDKTMARQLALYKLTVAFERPLYCLAVGKDLKAQNQWLREYAAEKLGNLPPVLPGLTGDTVRQRYDAFTEFLRRGLKSLALHGMWAELGSSNYEHKTYRGLLALIDYATDPVVAARAKMFMDLAMVEIEQISVSGLRGGSKTRAKDGGLLGRFNRTTTMFHGEHHGFILEPPGFKNAYRTAEYVTVMSLPLNSQLPQLASAPNANVVRSPCEQPASRS